MSVESSTGDGLTVDQIRELIYPEPTWIDRIRAAPPASIVHWGVFSLAAIAGCVVLASVVLSLAGPVPLHHVAQQGGPPEERIVLAGRPVDDTV